MDATNILKIEPRWNERWANSPDIVVTIDCETPPMSECVWDKIDDKPSEPDHNFMLICTTFEPWVRFVHIADPTGRPELNGALGGDYLLRDGTVLHSRSGWSSREGVINKSYRETLKDELVDVTLMVPQWPTMGLAGWYIYKDALRGHRMWPEGFHLVREILFKGEEPYWHISTTEGVVTKPEIL